jgi:excisionase family DNA binding protein
MQTATLEPRTIFPLTSLDKYVIYMSMVRGKLTTAEAANRAGITWRTVQRWIAAGKVKPPKPTLVGAVGYRLWSADDVVRLSRVKERIYRKGRGRKKKPNA